MELVRGFILSAALMGTFSACHEAEVAELSFCVETDEQCREEFGYAVGADGEIRYAPKAYGLPYRGLFSAVKTRAFKDEFETTEELQARISATPGFIKKQFGEKFVLRNPLAGLTYDADSGLFLFRENREYVHELGIHTRRAFTERFSVVSQPCQAWGRGSSVECAKGKNIGSSAERLLCPSIERRANGREIGPEVAVQPRLRG